MAASLLILLAPLVQGGTPRLPTLAVELTIFSTIAAWSVGWRRAPRRELRVGLIDALLCVFLFWAFSSLLFAPYFHSAERALLLIVSYSLLYWYASFNPSFRGAALVRQALRAQGLLQCAVVAWQRFGAGEPRPAGTFFNPNFLAGFLAVAAITALGGVLFARDGGGAWRRAAGAAEVALLLGAILLTGSRGGLLALFAGMIALLVAYRVTIALAACTVGTVLLFAVPNPWVERLQNLPAGDVFAYTRLSIWRSALEMMRDHPLLGVGLGQFEHFSQVYAFPVKAHWAHYSRVAENAHCEYLQVGAEVGAVALGLWVCGAATLALAVARRLRELPRRAWGEIAIPAAALTSLLAHAAVDFPLHTPPAALLFILLAVELRMGGATGPEWPADLRVRPLYATAGIAAAVLLSAVAVRPVIGFAYFLRGTGAPVALLREKWAMEEADRTQPPLADALRDLGRAARIDFVCASYHRTLGSRYLRAFFTGEERDGTLEKGLYHLEFAAALNPRSHQYAMNLAVAMENLSRMERDGGRHLREAIAQLERAAALAPRYYLVQGELGRLLDLSGETAKAERALRRAVELEEYALPGWLNLGRFYARHGDLAKAREAWSRGAEYAGRARAIVPVTPYEKDLLALDGDIFYDELKRLERFDQGQADQR